MMRTADPLFTGDTPVIHPFFLVRNMMTLLAYSYDYGRPSIHAGSHIQNFARIPAGEELALTGHFAAAYEQRGHHYAVFDGSVRSVGTVANSRASATQTSSRSLAAKPPRARTGIPAT